jgi:hypothetical protein
MSRKELFPDVWSYEQWKHNKFDLYIQLYGQCCVLSTYSPRYIEAGLHNHGIVSVYTARVYTNFRATLSATPKELQGRGLAPPCS